MSIATIQKFLQHSLVRNAGALTGLQIATYVVPVLTVPYLARVLGPTEWGKVAFGQALGFCLAIVVEFGFVYSASRDIARHRNDRSELAKIASSVLGAKIALSALVTMAALALQQVLPRFALSPAFVWGAILWALAQGFSVVWYFQGVEKLPLASSVETVGKIFGTLLIFVFVRNPTHSWKVLLILGSTTLVADIINLALMYSEVALEFPRPEAVISHLRAGSTLFLFRAAITSYTAGNAFLLGLAWPASTVAYFAGPEKITRALLGLLSPISQVLYPRVSYLLRCNPREAFQLARKGFVVMACAGSLMAISVYLFAPLMIRLFLGHQYIQAVPVLRILALLPPLIAVNTAMGLQWMLPLGLEKSYTRVLLYAGALNLLVAASLGLRFAHIGMAWTVVGSETFIAIASYIMLRRRGLDLAFHGGIELDRRESIVDRIQELQIAPEATNGRS
jgi:PST family polysaccharide transporter